MTKKLCLLWQDQDSRNWYHVGNLLEENEKYIFYYETEKENRNVHEALENGYRLHPTFPNLEEKYESSILFSAFARRLPDKDREDYKMMLTNLGVTPEMSDFEFMGITNGVVHSDHYEFLKPIVLDGSAVHIDFYLRGWRHYNDDEDSLSENEKLLLEKEPDNAYDHTAVKIKKTDGQLIGYVPEFYSAFITKVLDEQLNFTLDYSFNEEAVSHYKVSFAFTVNEIPEHLIAELSGLTEALV